MTSRWNFISIVREHLKTLPVIAFLINGGDLGKMTLQNMVQRKYLSIQHLISFFNAKSNSLLWTLNKKHGKCIMHDNIIHLNWRCCHFPLPYSMTFCPILVLMELTRHIWIHKYIHKNMNICIWLYISNDVSGVT